MTFATDFDSLSETSPPTAFRFASQIVDPTWIEDALAATGTRSIRRRKLPAEAVVWLVIAMAMFRDQSIHTVVTQLGLVNDPDSPKGRGRVVPAAIAQARRRLGDKPMEELFNRLAEKWAFAAAEADRWHGLAVFAVDGTSFNVADTPKNEKAFGRSKSGSKPSAYPKMRVVALNVPRTHELAALVVGSYATSEQELAKELWERVPDNSVLLIDRGFLAYTRLHRHNAPDRNRHWVSRAKSTTKARTIKRLSDGSEIAELAISRRDRKQDSTLPRTMKVRVIHYQIPGHEPQRILTSLLDHVAHPAREVAALYHERWEIELGFREKKSRMLQRREALRSKTPKGTRQELWGLAIAYNVVRRKIAETARSIGIPPRRISFLNALQVIRAFALSAGHFAPGVLPKQLRYLEEDISHFILPVRRFRSNPREVKVKMSNFARKPLRGSSSRKTEPSRKTKARRAGVK